MDISCLSGLGKDRLLTNDHNDSNNDRSILFHAAPVSGRCYNLDGKTRAFFWATGGMLNPRGMSVSVKTSDDIAYADL